MRQAKEIGEKMKDLVESYCAKGSVSNYDQLAHQLLDHVGDQHCLWCKVLNTISYGKFRNLSKLQKNIR